MQTLGDLDSFGGVRWESSSRLVDEWSALARDTHDPRIVRRAVARARIERGANSLSAPDVRLLEEHGGWASGGARAAWRRWLEGQPAKGDSVAVARDLPPLLGKSVLALEAERIGDGRTARRLRDEVSNAASRRLVVIGAGTMLPLVIGPPLWLWTAVVGSGRRRRAVAGAIIAVAAAAVAGTGMWMARSSGSPFLGVAWAFAATVPAGCVAGIAGFAALRGRSIIAKQEADAESVPPPWRISAECVLAYLGLHQGAQWVVAALGIDGARWVFALAAAQGISGTLAIAYAARRLASAGSSLRGIGWGSKAPLRDIGAGCVGWAMLVPLTALAGFLSKQLLGAFEQLHPNPVLDLLLSQNTAIRMALASMAVIGAPFFEEFFFRGILQSGLRRARGLPMALIVGGLAFAALHPIVDALPILVLAVGLGLLRDRRASLLPAMVAHMLQNGSATVATLLSFG